MAVVAEGQHWYYPDGRPCYEVPYADPSKGMRPATIADARKIGLVPGYTKIAEVRARPGLDKWKLQQLLMSALTLPRHEGEYDDEYAERVIQDAGEQSRKARDQGKALHAAVERYAKGEEMDIEFARHITALNESLELYGIDLRDGETETAFASPLGYGGRVDWRYRTTVLDVKTKQALPDNKVKLVYDEHPMQLAAYAKGLGIKLNEARCLSVFIGITDARVRIFEYTTEDINRGWLMFGACLTLWQLQANFGPYKK